MNGLTEFTATAICAVIGHITFTNEDLQVFNGYLKDGGYFFKYFGKFNYYYYYLKNFGYVGRHTRHTARSAPEHAGRSRFLQKIPNGTKRKCHA